MPSMTPVASDPTSRPASCRPEEKTDKYWYGDAQSAGQQHAPNRATGRDVHTPLTVGADAFHPLAQSLESLGKLTAHLDNHGVGAGAHGVEEHGAEPEGQHGPNQQAGEDRWIAQGQHQPGATRHTEQAASMAINNVGAEESDGRKAALPMANPLPMAAVELPTASRLSVIARTDGSSSISAIPPALSA